METPIHRLRIIVARDHSDNTGAQSGDGLQFANVWKIHPNQHAREFADVDRFRDHAEFATPIQHRADTDGACGTFE